MRWALVFAVALAGCAEVRVNNTASRVGPNLDYAQFDQIKVQLSRSIDNPYRIPSFAFVSTAVVSAADSISGNTVQTSAASLTQVYGLTVGPLNNSYSYTFTTVTDVDSLERVRDIYAYAITNDPRDWKPYFDRLVMKPPRRQWLYWDDVNRPLHAKLSLGTVGEHTMWTDDMKAYNDFSLAVLNALRTDGVFKGAMPGSQQGASRSGGGGGRSLTTTQPVIMLVPQ